MFYVNIQTLSNNILHIGYDDDGNRFVIKDEVTPTVGIKTNKKTDLKTMEGDTVELKRFDTIKDYRHYVREHKDIIELYDVIDPKYKFIHHNYKGEIDYNFDHIKILELDIEVLSDEGFPYPQYAEKPIISISIKDRQTGKYYVFGRKEYDKLKNKYVEPDAISYKGCDSEKNLLKHFIKTIKYLEPDIIVGWNSHGFDFPYLFNRIIKILGEKELKELSPIKKVRFDMREKEFSGQKETVFTCEAVGITLLDYMDLYKKYMYGDRESYSLDFISELELGENKINYSEYDDLMTLYKNDFNKFIDYNIYDAELIDKLEDKLGLIKLLCSVAYMAKCNFQDVLSPVKTWDVYIYNYLLDKNIVIPPMKSNVKVPFPGAYVHDVKPGIYKWVVSFDLNSLYPMIQIMYNISPECLVDGKTEGVDQKKIDDKFLTKEINIDRDYILAGNGQYFRKDIKGFLPEIFEGVYINRKNIKKQMLKAEQELENIKEKIKNSKVINNELNIKKTKLQTEIAQKNAIQLALKILLNSSYGSLANKYFRYFDMRLASAVTMSGQLAIKWISKKLNEFIENKYKIKNSCIYMDTDSSYLYLNELVEQVRKKKPNITKNQIIKFLDNFCSKVLEPFIDNSYQELSNYMNCNENKMVMKREAIAESGLWTTKKRYALNVWDSEGVKYKEAKLKVKGIEIVRSSTPKAVKAFLKESINVLLKNPDDIQEKIVEIKKAFYELTPEEIAFPRSVNGVSKYTDHANIYKKGTPIGVRAALLHNDFIKRNDLEGEFLLIKNGAKIKYLFMKTPNVINNENIFGYIKRIPKRDSIIKYVDYKTQFEKAFLSVLRNITGRIGIEISDKNETNLKILF